MKMFSAYFQIFNDSLLIYTQGRSSQYKLKYLTVIERLVFHHESFSNIFYCVLFDRMIDENKKY